MPDFYYKIEFLSDWHCGSGLTSGSDVDLLTIKDENGLAFIPGKTMKGLLKEAALILANFAEDESEWFNFVDKNFEIEAEKNLADNDKNFSEKGLCYFSNAVLSDKVQNKLIDKENLKSTLYRKISFTAIDKDGLVKEHSLRKIEVTIPLELYGRIYPVEAVDQEKMKKCLNYIKRIGYNRNRGLGRCKLSAWEV